MRTSKGPCQCAAVLLVAAACWERVWCWELQRWHLPACSNMQALDQSSAECFAKGHVSGEVHLLQGAPCRTCLDISPDALGSLRRNCPPVQAPRVPCTWWLTGLCGLLRVPCTTTVAPSPPLARALAQLRRQSGCCRQVHTHAPGILKDMPAAWLVLGLLWQGACGCQCMPCAGYRHPALLETSKLNKVVPIWYLRMTSVRPAAGGAAAEPAEQVCHAHWG